MELINHGCIVLQTLLFPMYRTNLPVMEDFGNGLHA